VRCERLPTQQNPPNTRPHNNTRRDKLLPIALPSSPNPSHPSPLHRFFLVSPFSHKKRNPHALRHTWIRGQISPFCLFSPYYLLSLGSPVSHKRHSSSSSDLTLLYKNPRNMRMQRALLPVHTSHYYSTKPASARPTTATAYERTNKTLPTKHRARVLR
jgi:uncharacterized Zn-finger protein